MLDEGRLYGVEPGLPESLNRHDLLAGHFLYRHRARADRLLVHNHGAGPAQPLAAAELGAGQSQVASQHPKQHAIVFHLHARRPSVEREGNGSLHENLPGPRVCRESSDFELLSSFPSVASGDPHGGSIMAPQMPDNANIILNVYDGKRQLLDKSVRWSAQAIDGRSLNERATLLFPDLHGGSQVLTVPAFDNFGDNYTIIVNADGYQLNAWRPVTVSARGPVTASII